MYKRIIAVILTLILLIAPLSLSTQTVYASDFTLSIGDYSTWDDIASAYGKNVMQYLKGIADSLGMSCSAFCSAVSSGAVSLAPYLMGAVAIGSACYLGYDLYTNWHGICDQVKTQLSGGSAYADWWFENYAEGILNGTYDLSNGIEVPITMFRDMTLALSDILTYDKTAELKNTVYRADTSALTKKELSAWVQTLGYQGSYACTSVTTTTPVVCMYNVDTQEYYLFVARSASGYKDLLFVEVADEIFMQVQHDGIVSDIGYALQPIANNSVIWTSYSVASAYTVSLTSRFESFAIDNGAITVGHSDKTYDLSILCPDTCSVVAANVSYSELAYPLTHDVDGVSYKLLPVYWQVTGLSISDMSIVDTKVNTEALDIPDDFIGAIDDAINAGDDIPLVLPWAKVADWVSDDSVPDTTAITMDIGKSVDDSNDDTTTNIVTVVWDGLLDILKDFAYWLFVPSDGFMDGFLQDMTAKYEKCTGILTYPIVVLIQFFNRLTAINNVDAVLTIPDVAWKDYIIFPSQSINLSAYIRDNKDIQSLYNYYMIFCRGLLVLFVLNLARKKQEEMTRG